MSSSSVAPPKWSAEELKMLVTMRESGAPFKRIAASIGRSESAIRIQSKRQGLDATRPDWHLSRHSKDRRPLDGDGMDFGERDLLSNQEASRLHLEDLENAGHVRGIGELKIGADSMSPMRIAVPLYPASLTGSSAAMCAESAGRGY